MSNRHYDIDVGSQGGGIDFNPFEFAGDLAGTFGDIYAADQASEANQRSISANMLNSQYDRAMQREFAQMGVRWKVADAYAAGIDPLVAMGAQTHSATPTAVGVEADNSGAQLASRLGDRFGNMLRKADPSVRKREQLDLENQRLQNELLRSQIAKENSAQGLPGNGVIAGADVLLDGQGNARPMRNPVIDEPMKRIVSEKGRPYKEAGAVPDFTHVRTPHGYAIIPGKDVKERIEDTLVPEAMWALRNNWMPNFAPKKYEPKARLPKGYDYWKWDYVLQQYVPGKKDFVSKMKRKDFDKLGNAIRFPRRK